MSGSIDVAGGTDGTSARFEDMLGVAELLDRAADDVADARDAVAVRELLWCMNDGDLEFFDGVLVRAVLGELTSPFGALAIVSYSLREDAARLRSASAAYRETDSGVVSFLQSFIGALPGALGAGAVGVLTGHGTGDVAQIVLAEDPALVDEAAFLSPVRPLEQIIGFDYPDGHAVVHDLGIDTRPLTPPRGLADLIGALAVRDDGAAGEISVAFVTGADRRRRAIVDIPGTKSWSSGATSNITSLSTNARALVGAPTSYEDGVLEAMNRAGVDESDEVMLVGHSEGGMVAVGAARDAVRSGRFRVTHVVTAGSPIGLTVGAVPSSVRVLALENEADLVPHVDGHANPDRRNVTTVTVHHGDGTVGDDHDLRDSYQPGAWDADQSSNASVRDFTRSAGGFFGATAITTRAYLITRSYR